MIESMTQKMHVNSKRYTPSETVISKMTNRKTAKILLNVSPVIWHWKWDNFITYEGKTFGNWQVVLLTNIKNTVACEKEGSYQENKRNYKKKQTVANNQKQVTDIFIWHMRKGCLENLTLTGYPESKRSKEKQWVS